MDSEGRGEQILKTDQDNALLLRDLDEPAAAAARRPWRPGWLSASSAALATSATRPAQAASC